MRKLSPVQLLALGFAIIIFVGACLLALPFASRDGEALRFYDALFTAVSATCVTGLVVCDTATQFSFFGQLVIICLIQIGGLGFMAVATLGMMILRKRIGLKSRSRLVEAEGALQLGGVVRMTRRILLGTAFVEGLGTLLLCVRFLPRFGTWKGLWYALFHAVSAFCNAGFDLFGAVEPYSSLCTLEGDPYVLCVLSALILTGGIGFLVWDDLAENKLHARKWRLHTKLALSAAAVLTLAGMALFLVTEREGVLQEMGAGKRLAAVLFLSVSPRTAGFNAVDLRALSPAGVTLTILLMVVGASPGSTGGGMKTTTVAAVVLSLGALAASRRDATVFGRRIEEHTVYRAFRSAMLYLLLAAFGCMAILVAQPLDVTDTFFEVFSALGTVGLTLGATQELNGFSRAVVMLLMYAGRVGSLSMMTAVALRRRTSALRCPEERILIG